MHIIIIRQYILLQISSPDRSLKTEKSRVRDTSLKASPEPAEGLQSDEPMSKDK